MLGKIAPYRKAITGALIGALTMLGTALTDGHVTAAEWVAVLLAAVASGGGVWAVPNTPKAPQ